MVGEIQQSIEIGIPIRHCVKQNHDRNNRHGQRQDDRKKDPKIIRAVYLRRLLNFPCDGRGHVCSHDNDVPYAQRARENKAENIEKNGMKFSIYGLELDSSVNRKFKKADVTEKTVEEKIGKKGKDYSILMAHNPAYMDAYKKWGADLILSGHLHGGLVRCPGIGAVVTPQGFLFPKYSGEMRREGEQTIVVSRGLGSHTINIRLFNMPEVIAIEVCVR